MSDDELTALQEELATTRAELARLQVTAADSQARASHLDAQVAQVRDELEASRSQAQAGEQELASLRERSESLQTQVQGSAQRYRELALQQAPELPAELVAGDTVDEVEESLQRARETVARVRGHLEQQAQAGRVPVGAPPRSGPDMSALSAEDKIRLGLQQGG
jgi:chromosome segregation ATPase